MSSTAVVYPTWEATEVPQGATCQETRGLVDGWQDAMNSGKDHYLRCGKPATCVVTTKDPNPYYMCNEHGDHTVTNRGGHYLVPPTSLAAASGVEILLPSQSPKLREDLATMAKCARDLGVVLVKLKALKIVDAASRELAGEYVAEYKRIEKLGIETIEPHKRIVNNFREEYTLKPERLVKNGAEQCRAEIEPRLGMWDRAVEAADRAAKERQKREEKERLDRLAEEKRQADAEQAKELRKQQAAQARQDYNSGVFGPVSSKKAKSELAKRLAAAQEMEESLKLQAEADHEEAMEQNAQKVETIQVKSSVPKVAGNVRRVNWKAQCADVDKFLLMWATSKKSDPMLHARLRRAIFVDDKYLSQQARERIKTSDQDDNPKHDLTAEQFEKLYPFVKTAEDRSY